MAQAVEFKYAPMFQLGKDDTEYYLLTKDYVSEGEFEGHKILKVQPEALTLLAKQDLPTFGYNMIDPLKSWCWGSILFYPFKISRFS